METAEFSYQLQSWSHPYRFVVNRKVLHGRVSTVG